MKTFNKLFLAAAAALVLASCYDDTELRETLNNQADKIEQQANDIKTLQGLVQALDKKLAVSEVTGTEDGFKVTFSDGTVKEIKNGLNGTNGTNGANGKDGENGLNGNNGENGKTPQLKIENGAWKVSYDEGATWSDVATDDSDKVLNGVTVDGNVVTFNLGNGMTFTFVAEEPSVTVGGEKYKIAKMPDGRWWMVENLRYIPEGCTIGNGVYYPCKDDALASDDSAEGIKAKGLLYADSLVFKKVITADNYNSLEKTQGICPDGWYIPTGAEFMNLVGKSNDATKYPTIATAPFYDATLGNGGNGSLVKLGESGFNTTMAGYTNNGAIAGYLANKSAITMSYIYSSSSKSATQFYALMLNGANSTCPVGFLNNSAATKPVCASVRCIKNE